MAFQEAMIGKRERLSWVAETSYGTGGDMAVNGEVIGYNATISPNFDQSWQEVLSAGADTRAVPTRVLGALKLGFTLSFIPYDWKWLKYVMSVIDSGGPVYDHTFSINNSIQSFKLEWAMRHTTPHVVTLSGCVITSATISFQKSGGEGSDGHITVNANCIAQDITSGTSVTTLAGGNPSATPFQFRMAKVTLESNEIVEVNNGELTIDNGINEDDSRYCNATLNRKLGEPIPTVFRVNGRFNVNVLDDTYYDMWTGGAALSGTNTLLIDRDASGDDQILFTFNDLRIGTHTSGTNLEGVKNMDIVFMNDNGFTSVVARDAISTY